MATTVRAQIGRALEEWLSALDVLKEPIFLHDASFRIIRCNNAYRQLAGLPYRQIIGQYYYDVFPKRDGPLPYCRHAKETAYTSSDKDAISVGDTLFLSRAYVVNDEAGNYRYSIHIFEDVTEQQKVQEMLLYEKNFSEKLIESIPDIFFLMDSTGHFLRWNRKIEQLTGRHGETLKGRDALEFVHEADRSYLQKQLTRTLAGGSTVSEARLLTREGVRHYALTTKRIDTPLDNAVIGIGIDITDYKAAMRQIARERDFNRDLVETAQAVILLLDPAGRIVRFNRYMEELSGYTLEEVRGKDWFETFLPEAARDGTRKTFLNAVKDAQSHGLIDAIVTKKGAIRQIAWHDKTLKDSRGETEGLLAIGMDVTEHQQALQRLELFHTLFDQSMDAVHVLEPVTLRFLDVNETACRRLGYSRDELLSMSVYDIDPTLTVERGKRIADGFKKNGSTLFESIHRRRDGTAFPVEISTSNVMVDRPYLVSIVRDISERKASEAALRRANRALRTLSQGNLALVRATDEKTLLHEVTKVLVEHGGYDLAAVHFAHQEKNKMLTPVAWSGFGQKRYWIHGLHWDEGKRSNFPAGNAVRKATTQICRDISSEAAWRPWQKAALNQGYLSTIALPLFKGKKVFGVLSIYSSHWQTFDANEVELLEELAADLSYGILNLRTRAAHDRHEALLRDSLEQSIQAIAATVESRDPYTAGHQKRVAELSTAIGREMGLDAERIQAIGFAGIIHDLGKIHIPAEILSKPGKLSDIEYKLIQTHPEAGYEIVKDVLFPWPIAQIILQHHERLDGSGYPQGLKSDAILLEAKIIAVADTVDAISSHRPYRSARGIDIALQEIKNGSGTAFDPASVEACVRLFTEKGFAFETESPLLAVS